MNDFPAAKEYVDALFTIMKYGDGGIKEEAEEIVQGLRQGEDVTKYMDGFVFVCAVCGERFDTEKRFISHHSHRKWGHPEEYSDYYLDDLVVEGL